jgi:hypothetical protein
MQILQSVELFSDDLLDHSTADCREIMISCLSGLAWYDNRANEEAEVATPKGKALLLV